MGGSRSATALLLGSLTAHPAKTRDAAGALHIALARGASGPRILSKNTHATQVAAGNTSGFTPTARVELRLLATLE
jgi:hypothetical protein